MATILWPFFHPCISLEMQQVELAQAGLQPRQGISTVWLPSIQQGKFKLDFVLCIVQSHEIKWVFCNQELNRWWLKSTRSCCQFSFIWPSSFVWDGCVEGERGPWWACSTCSIRSSTPVPPCWAVSTGCHVCPCSAGLWYDPTMFYIPCCFVSLLYLEVVVLFVWLFWFNCLLKTSHIIHATDNTNIFCWNDYFFIKRGSTAVS
jgi:hypothetical protein